jgi:hypothetical protein
VAIGLDIGRNKSIEISLEPLDAEERVVLWLVDGKDGLALFESQLNSFFFKTL